MMSCNIYLAESSPTKIRGAIVTTLIIALSLGLLVSYAIGLIINSWQWMLGISVFPALVQFIFMLLAMPETPSFLAEKGHIYEAENIMHESFNKDSIVGRLDQ